jgi:hypothetical protein
MLIIKTSEDVKWVEFKAGKKTPGWRLQNNDKIEHNPKGFEKLLLNGTIDVYYKLLCIVYQLACDTRWRKSNAINY